MDILWVFCVFSIGFLCVSCGFSVNILWAFLWVFCELSVNILWVFCGFSVGFL